MRGLVLAVVSCCLIAGCASSGADKKEATASASAQLTVANAGKPINKYCPVNREDEADPTVTTIYKGQVIAFCCEDCVPKFKENPEKYMKDIK